MPLSTSQDITNLQVTQVSRGILHGRTHARKQAHPRRAIKKDANSLSAASQGCFLPSLTSDARIRPHTAQPAISFYSAKHKEFYSLLSQAKPAAQLKRKACTEERLIRDSIDCPTGPFWTTEQISLLLRTVKDYKGQKTEALWSLVADLLGRTPEACKKKYFKIKKDLA